MAYEENGGVNMSMPVMPAYGGFGGGFGSMGGFGGDGWWLILLLLCMGNGMWGGFGMGGFGGGLGYDFPWLLAGQNNLGNQMNDGFRDAQLHDSVTSVRDGVSALSTQLCGCCGDMQMSMANGFAGVNAAVTGAANSLSQQLNTNEIANLNRSFAEQAANTQGFTGVNAGLADLKYVVATENCADRTAATQNTQSILTALNAGVQSIKDQLCQDKIDAKNDEISQLRQEVLYARGQASQVAQNSDIINGVYNRLSQCPIGTTPVYGNSPIFSCPQSYNPGCGCGNSFVA